MDDVNELIERSLAKLDDLVESIEDVKALPSSHQEAYEDILYEIQELRTTLEDQLED